MPARMMAMIVAGLASIGAVLVYAQRAGDRARFQPARSGGGRSSGRHTVGPSEPPRPAGKRRIPTRAELYDRAKRLDIPGRSRMSKAELANALQRRTGEPIRA